MTSHFTHTAILRGRNYLPCFTGEETEAQRSQVTSPKATQPGSGRARIQTLFGRVSSSTSASPARQAVGTAARGRAGPALQSHGRIPSGARRGRNLAASEAVEKPTSPKLFYVKPDS